jgi:secretion/DNA translocation related CpaE-like protein
MPEIPARAPSALLVSRDEDVVRALFDHCAAADVAAQIIDSRESLAPLWRQATAVLVGSDLAEQLMEWRLPRRDRVLLVSAGPPVDQDWRQAVAVGASGVVALPGELATLSRFLADLSDPAAARLTVGVVGATGGAGASTLAAGLGLVAAQSRQRALLVDLDQVGGGVELVVGCEDVPGVRWADMGELHGQVSGSALRAALPAVGDLAVLSWDGRGGVVLDGSLVQTVLRSARQAADVMILDLPRRLDDVLGSAVGSSQVVLLVVTADVRAVASAQRWLPDLRRRGVQVRVVVRPIRGAGISAADTRAALNAPSCPDLPNSQRLARAVNDGLGPLVERRYERSCRRILSQLLAEQAAA